MAIRVIKINEDVGKAIRNRRIELGYTMEELAKKANIGTKTLSRYESGESIRYDKLKSLLKTLKWNKLPETTEDFNNFDIVYYRSNPYWSKYLEEEYGLYAAISFVIGAENLSDFLQEDINNISCLPKNSHLGQLEMSWLFDMLPEQFLMEYNYEFLYAARSALQKLIRRVVNDKNFIVHTVMDELLIRLIVEYSRAEMDEIVRKTSEKDKTDIFWDQWRFEICEDDDIDIFLYDNWVIDETNIYHFKNWFIPQFYIKK